VRSASIYGVVNKNGLSKIFTTTNTSDPEYTEDNPFEELPAPNVRGLELFDQGNDTEFTGRDAKFTWRKSTLNDWVDLGYEGLKGASNAVLDQYFRDYEVEITANDEVVRTENVVDNFYTYTYEKNAEDYERRYGVPGAYREFRISVVMRTRQNQESPKPAVIDVTNTAPKALENVVVNPGFNVIEISYKRPTDLDFAGVDIWIETTQGFDPDATEPFATISDNSFVASGLNQDTVYYVRLRPFDEFGKTGTNTTSEFTVTTKTGQDLTGLSGWAYELDPVDETFINTNLAGNAVPSEKIKNLTAAKLTAGVINATGAITTESIFRAVDDINNPQYQVGIGPLNIDGTSYLMWGYDANAGVGDKLKFGIDELGNAYFRGDITGASGTFSGSLNINSNFVVDSSGNVDSSGGFRFGGATNNFIDYNGSKLAINTDNFTVDPQGNATFSGSLQAASGTFAGQLQAATGSFTGDVTLTGDNLWADTRVQIGTGQNGADYVVLDVDNEGNGVVETYKEFDGQHRQFKSLTRTEVGVANSGATVTLPGYWAEQPRIQVSPNTVPTYDATYPKQSQQWACRAEDLTEVSQGVWQFKAVSDLTLGTATGSKVVDDTYTGSSNYTSPAYATETLTESVNVHVNLKSVRGTGTSNSYYRREVLWRVGYASSAGGTYTWTGYKTKSMGTSLDYVSDNQSVTLPSSGTWYLKVDYVARDEGGTFSTGATQYEYDSATRTRTDTVTQEIDNFTGQYTLEYSTSGYTPPSGWSVYEVTYRYDYTYYLSASNGDASVNGSNFTLFYEAVNGSGTKGDFNLNSWSSVSYTTEASSYNANYFDGDMRATRRTTSGSALTKLGVRNANNTIKIRRPITNSTTPDNGFNFDYFNYSLSGAQILSEGVLNWMAVGS
jgi:hypothetical protein